MADAARTEANRNGMARLAPIVQRGMEFVGLSWLHDQAQDGRPTALVDLVAGGARLDYEAAAARARAQLRAAEAIYRSGIVSPTGTRW